MLKPILTLFIFICIFSCQKEDVLDSEKQSPKIDFVSFEPLEFTPSILLKSTHNGRQIIVKEIAKISINDKKMG